MVLGPGLAGRGCDLGSGAGGMAPLGDGRGHRATGSPAEKVSWTCSWITSRATKSCFSLKRPLYSRSPSRSLVANLCGSRARGQGMGHPLACQLPSHPTSPGSYSVPSRRLTPRSRPWARGLRMWKTSPNQNRNPGLPAPHPRGLGGRSDRWALVGEEGLLAKCTGKSKCTHLVLPTTCTQHPRCCPLTLSVEQEAPDSHHPLPPPAPQAQPLTRGPA